MVLYLAGQILTGYYEKNKLAEEGMAAFTMAQYLTSGYFPQATFENGERAFLQMALYVLLTVKLLQAGSSESKDSGKAEEVDRESKPAADAPVAGAQRRNLVKTI